MVNRNHFIYLLFLISFRRYNYFLSEKSNMNDIYIFSIFLLIYHFNVISAASKRDADDLKCIKANKWQDLISSTKTISDPSTCTKISKRCCYVNMTYSYINFDVSSQYCFSLSGSIDEFKEYLENLYQDDLYYFANFTYRNKYDMHFLGRQFEGNYLANYKCWKPPTQKMYSSYLYNNCGQFDHGQCLFEKDKLYFGNFTEAFYRNYSTDYCNKESGDGKCIMYNGTRSNNAMIRPLLKDLIDYLHIDDTNYDSDLGDGGIIEIDPDAEENIKELWNKTTNCTDIPKVNFEVICPSSYVYGNYLKMNLYSVSILIFIVLFII